MTKETTISPAERVRERLTRLPGVRGVDVSRFPDRISLRCDTGATRELTSEIVRSLLRAETGLEPEVNIDFAQSQSSRALRRSRFDSLTISTPEPGRVAVRTVLEWNRQQYEGVSEEEANPAGELRACAIATIRAVEKFAAGRATFTLVGAKELHVFDHDLVAVLLNSPDLPDRRLIGTSIIVEDRRRAAAFAVLNATNRVVGSIM